MQIRDFRDGYVVPSESSSRLMIREGSLCKIYSSVRIGRQMAMPSRKFHVYISSKSQVDVIHFIIVPLKV